VASGGSLADVMSPHDCVKVPHNIISDFDLGASENGVSVIMALREKYERCIPALVVTGKFDDAAAALAQLQSVKVYAKPLSTSRLRWALESVNTMHQTAP
jgi:two-component system, sensor histidine kinase